MPRHPLSIYCLLLFAGAASASDWSAQPRLSMGFDSDTNPRLATEPRSSRVAQLHATLDIARAGPTQRLHLRPRATLRRFDGVNDGLDSNDGALDLQWQLDGEKSQVRLGANAALDSTLVTELEDTGIIEDRTRRRTLSANANYTRRSGARGAWQLGASAIDVDFEDSSGTGLTPYRYPGVQIGYSFGSSETSELSVSATANRLDVQSTGDRTTNTGLRARWVAKLNERFTLDAAAGIDRARTDASEEDGATYSLAGTWNGARSTVGLTAGRGVEPSARGRLVRADSFGLTWQWWMGERTSFSLRAHHAIRENLLFGLFSEKREYSDLGAGIDWRLTEDWRLELRAGARAQRYEAVQYEADGARIGIAFSWIPQHLGAAQ